MSAALDKLRAVDLRRRQVLRIALTASVLTGCKGAGQGSSEVASSAGGRKISTAVGELIVSGGSFDHWQPLLRGAATRVADAWGRTASPIPISLCSSDEEFEESASGLVDVTAAVTTSRGIFVGPAVERTLTSAGQEMVLAHEITHMRLRHFGSDRTALWVKEGAAEWTAAQGLTLPAKQLWPNLTHLSRASYPSSPPSADEFQSHPALAYETAAAYATYLVDVWGRGQFQSFVRTRPREESAVVIVKREVRSQKTFPMWLTEKLSAA